MRSATNAEVQPADPAESSAHALRAVQVALDRRDNGGDADQADDQQGTR